MNIFLNKGDAEQEATFCCLSSQAILDGATSKKPFTPGFCHLFLRTQNVSSELYILTRTWIITDLGVEIGTQDPPKILEPHTFMSSSVSGRHLLENFYKFIKNNVQGQDI
jgi:hypothetical protein